MELKALFGILSVVFTFAGLVPYFKNIKKKKIYPHNLSWIGWSFITFIGAIAMLGAGVHWSVALLFANGSVCLIVVLYSIYKKVGIWSTTSFDYILFTLGILGIILWQLFNAPLIAIICCIFADLFFGIPTIIKVYKDPKSELDIAWLSCSVAAVFSLFAIKNFTLSEFLYPFYLFIFDTSVFILIVVLKNKRSAIMRE